MSQHTESAYSDRYSFNPERCTGISLSSKREKFLFENSSHRKSAYAGGQPVVTYRNPPKLVQNDFVMRIIVDTDSITGLRHLILKTCGDMVSFIRVKPIDHAKKMKVWLCLSKSSVDTVISNIMHVMPHAELGKVTPLLPE